MERGPYQKSPRSLEQCGVTIISSTVGSNLREDSISIIITLILRIRLDSAYFVKNRKHSNKIIFKYVNSIMRPIFNEKVAEKKGLWIP